MCHLFAHQPQRDYESPDPIVADRWPLHVDLPNVVLGHSGRDRGEGERGPSPFLPALHNEVLDHHGGQ